MNHNIHLTKYNKTASRRYNTQVVTLSLRQVNEKFDEMDIQNTQPDNLNIN